jgi:hypothetical protein
MHCRRPAAALIAALLLMATAVCASRVPVALLEDPCAQQLDEHTTGPR